MSDYGIKVSRDGYDVKTAAKRYLSLDSGQNIYKEKASGATTVAGGATVTIAHSLGYAPHFMAFIESAAGTNQMRLVDCAAVRHFAYAYADSTNLYIKNLAGGSARKVFFYIFYDPI